MAEAANVPICALCGDRVYHPFLDFGIIEPRAIQFCSLAHEEIWYALPETEQLNVIWGSTKRGDATRKALAEARYQPEAIGPVAYRPRFSTGPPAQCDCPMHAMTRQKIHTRGCSRSQLVFDEVEAHEMPLRAEAER